MRILFTGGGSGGHILPLIAVAREIRKIWPKDKEKVEFFYIGPKDDFGRILLSQEDIKIKQIFSGKIRRHLNWKSVFQNLFDVLVKIPAGTFQAFFYIFFSAPDLIFSKGGYGSIPAVLAGWLLRTPVFLHESDAVPGMANRFLSRFAMEIFVSFPNTLYFPLKKMLLTGNPIRKEIMESSREEAKDFFKIKREKPIILILGGSQGSQRINDKILNIIPQLLKDFEIIHQCGEKNYQQVKAEAKTMVNDEALEEYYHLFPFLKEEAVKKAYAVADLIVSRAGSGIIFEIAASARPSILIPLPESAQNHQLNNAYAYARTGATIVLEERNFTPYFFLEKLKNLFLNPQELEKMSQAAKNFSKPNAGNLIAEYIVEYLTK